jgi:hypothetical protein
VGTLPRAAFMRRKAAPLFGAASNYLLLLYILLASGEAWVHQRAYVLDELGPGSTLFSFIQKMFIHPTCP